MKMILFFATFIVLLHDDCVISAQVVPSIEWQRSLGGSSGETANSIEQTFDGGFITAGYSWSVNGDVTGNHGLSDYWIVKLDDAGNVLWEKAFGGSENDVAWAMEQTADSGFIIVGYSRSADGDIPVNKGLTDYCIMKLDASGNLTWQRSFGGSEDDWAYAVQQTTDLGFIVAGFSKSSDGDVTVNQGDWDYWIVRLDVNGNMMWQKSVGGSDEDEAYAVIQTPDGGFAVAGGSDSDDGDVSGNHGDDDYWIVRLDSMGNMLWQKSFGGSGGDYAYALQQTSDNGFILAGSSASNDQDVSGNHGFTDYWVMKSDADGNLLWQKSFGGSDYDIAGSIAQTTDGGFILTGDSYSSDGDVTENYGLDDYWILRLDTSGNLVWQKSLGGSGYDQANAIRQAADGGFIVAGLSFSNDHDVSGNHESSFGASEDYWIVKLTDEVESGINSVQGNTLSIFPNPVTDLLMIDPGPYPFDFAIGVYNVAGKKIRIPVNFNETQVQLNTSSLANGFYLVEFLDLNTGNIARGKFLKEK